MTAEISRLREGGRADAAAIRPRSGVYPDVLRQSGTVRERASTASADVRTQPGVSPHVSRQRRALAEPAKTGRDRARERSLAWTMHTATIRVS